MKLRSLLFLVASGVVFLLLLWTVSRRHDLILRDDGHKTSRISSRQEVLTSYQVRSTKVTVSANSSLTKTRKTPDREKQERQLEKTISIQDTTQQRDVETKSDKASETMPHSWGVVKKPFPIVSKHEEKQNNTTLQRNGAIVGKNPLTRSDNKPTDKRADSTCHSNAQMKKKSSWFTSKMNTQIPVFLNRVNSTVTVEAKRWWLANMGQRDTGMDDIIAKLLKVIPGRSSLRGGDTTCISCAIVGSAGNLRGSKYGTLIDSQDVIIRSNTSPLKGYEEDVGRRTTHQIIYPESADSYHPGAAIIFLPFKQVDFRWLTSIYTTKNFNTGFWRPVPKSLPNTVPEDTYIIHPDFLHYVQKNWMSGSGNKWPSAGTVSLSIGLHLCDELHVMGFGVNKFGLWDHYYDREVHVPQLKVSSLNHPVGLEEALRNKLKADNVITLYPGKT